MASPRWSFGVASALYGVCLMVLGAICLAAPAVSSLAVALVVGAVLAAAGVLGAMAAVGERRERGFWSKLAWAVLSVILGLWILSRPLQGAASVTLALGALFLARGLMIIVLALHRRQTLTGWIWPLLSGLVTVVLGGVILAGWPGTSLVALGIIVGVDLLFLGAALLVAALAVAGAPR